MKKILGLDLGTTSIGWAMVNEAENAQEQSSIVRLGVRVNPLTVDEQNNFEKGKPITTNADRTLKRSMRRSLQRYKLRRENLIAILKECGWINDSTILSEQGNNTTFETYRLRAKAATEEISLEQLARVLLMINKKRGYKSSRKAKSGDEGQLIDGMEVARILFEENITPGQYGYRLLKEGKRHLPEFYRSDLVSELDKIWTLQVQYHPDILTPDFRRQIERMSKTNTIKTFLGRYKIYTCDFKGKASDKALLLYQLRNDALNRQLSSEELATVISEVNGAANGSSGYLGAISDRSKELYFRHQTIGQRLMEKLDADPNTSLKNQPFYRQDYLDEFETIWQTQSAFHPELSEALKQKICSRVIFYQRPLRSQKWLVSTCEFENRKVCPKSSPIFQEFRILQVLNNIRVSSNTETRSLTEEERQSLWNELQYQSKMTEKDALRILFPKQKGLHLNFKELDGNRTMAQLLQASINILELSGHEIPNLENLSASGKTSAIQSVFGGLGYNTDWLSFDSNKKGSELDHQMLYRLWHLLYSYEGDNSNTGDESLVRHISDLLNLPSDYAKLFASIHFEEDYGNLSVKALQNILPFMQAGHIYSEACQLAGYRHSATSLTREELDNRELKDHLEVLPKNSLRNPVVEKILNQLVHVVNGVIDEYGRPDEVRIELARELKKNAKEREDLTRIISENTKEQERIKKKLQADFGPQYGSRNDIIRYRLWEELSANGYKALYSNKQIPYELIFSKEIDIEHIIPQARMFDDSFSNKTLEYRAVNIEKGNATALDYVAVKYGEQGVSEYRARIQDLFKAGCISQAKAKKLLMTEADIPSDFIDRDIRNTQYISRKAQEMLREIAREVTATTGSITDRLRQDWQLVDVMKELNWEKYDRLGLTEIQQGREGQQIRHIKGWTKRNDHRHHAMDALTIAFTKHSYIQYLNNLNARQDKTSDIYGIEQKELFRDKDHHLCFRAPMPIDVFREQAKQHLENILVSIKAKNKVVTRNSNKTKSKDGHNTKVQLTPRGQLHKETVCAQMRVPQLKEVSVGAKFTAEMIAQVKNPNYRKALASRLASFGGDPKKAFTGKNSLDKNPIWLDQLHTRAVPAKVVIEQFDIIYTVRKKVDENLKLDKVIDEGIRRILQARLDEFGGDPKKAFTNLDENPIWQNRQRGICIKSVRYKQLNNATPLHSKLDKDGNPILDKDGNKQPADFIDTGNNHHVAIFQDADGNLQEHIVSLFEATQAAILQLPIINKDYNKTLGWQFLFTLKQNEYFVFPNSATGFNPLEIDLLNPNNYARISPNLYRVQKLSTKYYVFRHHLETSVDDAKELRDTTWKRITAINNLKGVVKVRINHIGQIVQVSEY